MMCVNDSYCTGFCNDNAGCPSGWTCGAMTVPLKQGSCSSGAGSCTKDGDCPQGQKCVDGQCTSGTAACWTDGDCTQGQTCVGAQTDTIKGCIK